MTDADTPIWRPSPARIAGSQLTRYLNWLSEAHGRRFDDYESLWRWSVDQLEPFWQSVWDFFAIRSHAPHRRVLDQRKMPGAKWFDGALVNYAEMLLAPALDARFSAAPARGGRRPDSVAVVALSECAPRRELSWSELAADAGALAASLRRLGVKRGDRVVSYMPNITPALTALLATSSIGAIWSSCSPDMGSVSVLDRFRQIAPRVLFAVDGYRYGGKPFDRRETVAELVAQLPSLEHVIFVPHLDPHAQLALPALAGRAVSVLDYAQALALRAAPQFTPVPFDHPLWVVYSSGTTGMPKPIVHGHGGTIVENLKGTSLHLDVRAGDRFFWFSSTNWIMWNLLVSTLMTGATIVLFDGNPGHPDLSTLWHMAERERLDFFGTSPAFIGACMKAGFAPREHVDLTRIRTVGSTGSPLTQEGYAWVYRHVHHDLMLASVSGGTDPGAAFVCGCANLPIYVGEMQCRNLGSEIYAYDDAGQPVIGEVGELVCAAPMPSMPLYFWGDAGGKRYHDSYFDQFPGVWRHGDWIKLIRRPESVTSVIFGRSDSTINRHGIRMGTSELYRVVEEFAEVADSLVIDLEYLGKPSFMALFIVLREPGAADTGIGALGAAPDGLAASRGDSGVDPALKQRLAEAMRSRLSARHVPDDILAIPQVPRTLSGKKLEVPVKRILLGHPVEQAVNRDSMANPASIDWFIDFARGRAAMELNDTN